MKQFDWEKFKNKNNKIAVHCKTEEETKDFRKKMYEHGVKWCGGSPYLERTFYISHKEYICCYSCGASGLEYVKNKGYTIFEWSDYMKKDFTKSDLKDGMVLYFDDGSKAVLCIDFYITRDDMKSVNGKLMRERAGQKVTKIEYGDNTVWDAQTKHMTVEEMRQKLKELTGEMIEVEPNRDEMVGICYNYCSGISGEHCGKNCCLDGSGCCNFEDYTLDELKQCYEKVMEDGRKES